MDLNELSSAFIFDHNDLKHEYDKMML